MIKSRVFYQAASKLSYLGERSELRGRPILLITRMVTDRIGLHSVLLPLLIISRSNNQRLRSAGDNMEGQKAFASTLCFA